MNFILIIIFNVLFDLSLRDNLFSWLGIYLIRNRKCAPAARWLQYKKGGKILYSIKEEWNEGKISDHFMNVIIRQNREAVLVEFKGLFNPFFNAGVKGRSKDQGIVRISVLDCVYPFHISQAVFVWASIKDFNPAVGNSHCFTPFTIVLKASKPSG